MSSRVPLTNYPTTQLNIAAGSVDDNAQLHVAGYPKLAYFFSQCSRYLHVRRFSALAVRLLLYRQHQLILLEKNLLELEARDTNSNDPARQIFSADFAPLKAVAPTQDNSEQRELYEILKQELKEYEEAILRFDQLGAKAYDVAELTTIQWFLGHHNRNHRPFSGLDALTWGSLDRPNDYAKDVIQVVQRPNLSAIGRLFRNNILRLAPRFPSWLWLLLFWSQKQPNTFRYYSFSSRAIEVASLALGNLVTSLVVYAAVTSLYFTASEAGSVAGVVAIACTITLCSVLFRNQQFISMLATVCAVLVTLLLKDDNHRSQPAQGFHNGSSLSIPT